MKIKLAAVALVASVAMFCSNSNGDDLLNQMLDRGGCGGCEQVSTCCDTPAPACGGKARCGLFSGCKKKSCGGGLLGGGAACDTCCDTCAAPCDTGCGRSGLLAGMKSRKRCGTCGGGGLMGGAADCGCETCGPTCPEPVACGCEAPKKGCGLFARMKAKKGAGCCAVAEPCCDAPAPCAAPVADCGCEAAPACGCGKAKGCGLFARLKAGRATDSCCEAPVADCGCEAAPACDTGCGCRKGCRLTLRDRMNGNRIASRCRNDNCGDGCSAPCPNSGCGGACNGSVAPMYGNSIMSQPVPATPMEMQTVPADASAADATDGTVIMPDGDGARIYRNNPPIVNPSAFLIRNRN